MFADIQAFFTRIPKPLVTKIVADAVRDPEFMTLFTDAIHVELENMAELKEKSELFPIEEIGVAQGNSLSPLLGNILLHSFDRQMNEGDCVCIRYIDDFIIFAQPGRCLIAHAARPPYLEGLRHGIIGREVVAGPPAYPSAV